MKLNKIKSKYWVFIILFAITLLGAFLRFYKNSLNPPSLTGDEVSFGYSAYSILKTGKDEYGKILPLVFQSVGDYKNPIPVYLMVPVIKLFGLNDFSVRFPNAAFGALTIPVFFLFLRYLFKDDKRALLGSFLMSTSAWHIFYSRFAYEPLIASFFALLGVWFLMKVFDGHKLFAIPSAFFLVLTMYTAFAPRMFIPVFLLAVGIVKYKFFIKNIKTSFVFGFVCLLLVLPLIYVTFFMGAGTRFSMVFIGNDIEFSRYVLLKYFDSAKDVPLLIFYWAKRYLNYLQPEFLFVNALHTTTLDSFGLGILYLFEIPWLVLGVWKFIKEKFLHKDILVIWLLTGLIPDSLTNNQQHGGRLLHIAPVIIILTTLGVIEFVKLVRGIGNKFLKYAVGFGYSVFILLILLHAYLVVSVHFPWARGEYFDEGLREVSEYVGEHGGEYDAIVFDIRHGIEGPSMISNPFLYLLFYTKYDPFIYQTEPKTYGTPETPNYQFNKYSFGYINWTKDKDKVKTLFIGSPWSFPAGGLKEGELLKTIYLTNRHPAYYIVTPK